MSTHYVCTGGCGGVSDQPGQCQAEGCALHHQPLKECHCEGGEHHEVMEASDITEA